MFQNKMLKKIFNREKNKIKKMYKKVKDLLINSYCYYIYYHINIDEHLVFLASRDGKDFTGNIVRIAEELSNNEDYKNLKIAVYAKKEVWPQIKEYSQQYNLKKMKLIAKESIAVATMERAKYIVVDSSIPWGYVKRKGQVFLNTWHGTPFKVMGKKIEAERHTIGNVQHSFLSSDYLLYPNIYMKQTMLRDYMIENLIAGKVLLEGYPRNSVFFQDKRREQLRREFGVNEKQVFAYMPTHRGSKWVNKNKEQFQRVFEYLKEIDLLLKDDQIFLVKLHVFNQFKFDFSGFKHIFPFPKKYETYDVLNMADCLITDYSSVFFDFANTKRKIILFAYDKEEYFNDRGTYFDFESLPFPIVKNIGELFYEMNCDKNYDDRVFLEKYCTFDNAVATKKLCEHVFLNKKICREEIVGNKKENVLIVAGSLAKNGITTALVNLLNNIDHAKRNYYLVFKREEVNSEPERIDIIPQGINYIPLMCDQKYTFFERLAYEKYCKQQNPDEKFPDILHRLFQREIDRYYWGIEFSHVIQFDGYGKNVTMLLGEMQATKTIFVHNDMLNEMATRHYQHRPTLKYAYGLYDKVAVVSQDIIQPTIEISGKSENVIVVNNLEDPDSIKIRAEQGIMFENDTECRTYNPGGIEGVLKCSGKKFISIGRFSPEKSHTRLLEAFDLFCERYPDTQLIIIGGHGKLYESTVKLAKKMKYYRNITIIKSIQNPMPILKQCDLFVLSSLYEGLPMTIKEADILGVPVISTDIPGPRSFLKQYNGYLYENSVEGIIKGMNDFMDGKVKTLTIDYTEYNQNALKEFENLFFDKT